MSNNLNNNFEVDCEIEVEEVEEVELDVEMDNPSVEHNLLKNRDLPDQHPISAITNLEETLEDKVDKIEGKGLSTNDFTDEDKTKLDEIESGAEVNQVVAESIDKTITMKLSSLGY